MNNYQFSATDEFVPWMLGVFDAFEPITFRQHVAGDFYSAEYVSKWIEIVGRTRNTKHFAYTRSWRDPEILRELKKLAKFPHMKLWFSADVDTGRPPDVPNTRKAWLARDVAEEELTPEWADLVFRNETKTLRKHINGVQVCPVEIGLETENKLTCTKCKICFSPPKQAVLSPSLPSAYSQRKLRTLNVVRAV